MSELAGAWLGAGWLLGRLFHGHQPNTRADVLVLLERAETAIRNGWLEAALEALGRARRTLTQN